MKENKKVVTLFFQNDCGHVPSFPGSCIKDSVILSVEFYSVSLVAMLFGIIITWSNRNEICQYFQLVHNLQIPHISGSQPVSLWNSSKRFTHLCRHQILTINREK